MIRLWTKKNKLLIFKTLIGRNRIYIYNLHKYEKHTILPKNIDFF